MSKKIVQIVGHYVPFLGGLEKVAYELSTELARQGDEVEVITSTIGYDKKYRDVKIAGYRISRLFGVSVFGIPLIPMLLPHLLRQPAGSVFHIHIAQAFLPEVALFAARLRRAKVVMHFHLDVAPSGTFGFIFSMYKRVLFPYTLRLADNVIVFSAEQAELVHAKYGVSRSSITVIPNGVGKEYFSTKQRTLPDRPKLFFAGRISPQKNIQQLLHALDGVSDKFITTIAGEGELKGELESLVRSLDLKNVTFVGRIDGDELLAAYEHADIFVLPSEREGMPLVLLEAMAEGLPIIGTDVLGIRDLVDDHVNGLLVPYGDGKSMQKGLLKLLNNGELYEQLSRAAKQKAGLYAWVNVARDVREVYHAQ